MMHSLKFMLAVTLLVGSAAVPTPSRAEGTKSQATNASDKQRASVDEFEENRRAHSQKSKENNAGKSAN